jgi:hypothetical protein
MDEIANHFQWTTLASTAAAANCSTCPKYAEERDHARKLLEGRSLWWQTAFASRRLKSADDFIPPLFYCIEIDPMTCYRIRERDRHTNVIVRYCRISLRWSRDVIPKA